MITPWAPQDGLPLKRHVPFRSGTRRVNVPNVPACSAASAEVDRKRRRRASRRLGFEHQTGKRRVVVAIRQRKGRTLSFVVRQEADGVALVRAKVAADAKVHADEASHWDGLHAFFEAHCTNQVPFLTSRFGWL